MNVGEEGKGQMQENHRHVKQYNIYIWNCKQIELPMQCWRQTVTNEAQTSEAEVINKGLIVEDHVGHVHANDLGEVTIPSMGTSSVLSPPHS